MYILWNYTCNLIHNVYRVPEPILAVKQLDVSIRHYVEVKGWLLSDKMTCAFHFSEYQEITSCKNGNNY